MATLRQPNHVAAAWVPPRFQDLSRQNSKLRKRGEPRIVRHMASFITSRGNLMSRASPGVNSNLVLKPVPSCFSLCSRDRPVSGERHLATYTFKIDNHLARFEPKSCWRGRNGHAPFDLGSMYTLSWHTSRHACRQHLAGSQSCFCPLCVGQHESCHSP